MMKIKKGDEVKILLGKDRDKTGRVVRVLIKRGQAIVEGVNIYKRHVRKMGQSKGGIIDLAKPINISNLALVCPNCKRPTRVGYQTAGGTKLRICRQCNEVIEEKLIKK